MTTTYDEQGTARSTDSHIVPGAIGDAIEALAAPEPWPETLAESLVRALGALNNITATKTANIKPREGAPYSYDYADLADVLDEVRPVLYRFGLCALQGVANEGGRVTVRTTLVHWRGERWVTEPLSLPSGNNAQSVGSAITYARRYQEGALFNLATEGDDDGGAATRGAEQGEPRQSGAKARQSGARKRSTPKDDKPRSPAEEVASRFGVPIGRLLLDARNVAATIGHAAPSKAEDLDQELLAALVEVYEQAVKDEEPF